MGLSAEYSWLLRNLPYDESDRFDLFDEIFGPPAWATPLAAVAGELDDDGLRSFGRWVQERLRLGNDGGHDYDERLLEAVRFVAEADPAWTPSDVQRLWSTANHLSGWGHTNYAVLYQLPLAATERLDYPDRRRLLDDSRVWMRRYRRQIWDVIGERLTALLTEPEENDPAARVRNAIGDHDPFACMLDDEYGHRLGAEPVAPLLRHWATASSANPSPRWLGTARRLLTPEVPGLIREILERLAAHRERRVRNQWGDEDTIFLHQRTARALRGMVWTCELIDEPWVAPLLGDVALTCGVGMGGSGANCRSELLANAAVATLARRGGLDVVAALAKVTVKVRKKTVLANVSRALDAVAEQAGLTREQLLDRTVPDFGLDADGVREERIGDCLVRLSVDGPALRFVNPAGRTVKSAPQAIRKDPALAEMKAALKELKQTLAAERFRLERALIEERIWRWRDVCAYLLDHPVTGRYARDLIWQILQGPSGIPVRTADGWELTDPRGRRIQPFPDTPVLLWHPIRETAADVRAWRDHLLDRGVRQPFKQAFREVYLLTPAEEETRTYSLRFSGHVLRYGQAKALLNQRGWTGLAIGHWDYEFGADHGAAIKELAGWRARWAMRVASSGETDGWGTASHCATEEIHFYRAGQIPQEHHDLGPDACDAVPLAEVPPLILSEVMRDADLTVGVTSIGLDTEALAGHERYWQEYGFGELGETAKTRRDVLARLVPRLRIADRLELTDRFLRVRGDLRTYKIHLGSGNVLMEPNDAYLCVVPGFDRDAGSVFLPFEEDGGMLSIILSKAFLLADDTAITDPSITRQLG